MIEVRTAAGRFATHAEGRSTYHSFSFGSHYDPGNVGFASLVAHNDERLPPGTGYAEHPHADTEIVSWVLDGALRHSSTVGSAVLGPGSVQRLSAGSGVRHSEVSDHPQLTTRFVQTWVRPDESGLRPAWDSATVELGHGPGWTCLAGSGGVLSHGVARAALHVATLSEGERLELPDAPRMHLFVVATSPSLGLMLGERRLLDGDAARLHDEGARAVTAAGPVQLLVWTFA